MREAGAEWTVVRCQLVRAELQRGLPARRRCVDGVVALPAGDVAEPFVDVEDIADVAVAALTEDGHAGRIYELTGPRLLTFAEAPPSSAAPTGRQIRYVPVTVGASTPPARPTRACPGGRSRC